MPKTGKNSGSDFSFEHRARNRLPYMAPEPHRGTRNDSRNIPYVIAKIAEIKGVSVEEVEQTTRENAFALFTKVPR